MTDKKLELDRTKPPIPGKPKNIKFPTFFECKTSNGITVIVIENDKFPLVTVRFVFGAGSFENSKVDAGLSLITSELLSKGTSRMNAVEIAEEVDQLGASLSSGCDHDATFISQYSLKKFSDKLYNIATDIILDPVFKDEEIERLRTQKISSVISYKDDGDYLAGRVFKENVYGKNHYAFPTEGTTQSLTNISRDSIVNFYNSYYKPDNMIVAFVGDITIDEALKKVEDKFGSWTGNSKKSNTENNIKIKDSSKVHLVRKKGAVQSSLKIGHIAVERNTEDYFKIKVMNNILGDGFTSRINKNLREVNGYTYGANSYFDFKKLSGDFSIETEVKNAITANAVNEIIKEIKTIKEELVSEEELQNVKNYITGTFPMQLETPNAIASKVIALKLYDLPEDHFSTYISQINKVTKEDIKATAEKYLHPENLTISIGGNPDEISESMKQFGEVEVIEDIDNAE